MQSTLIRPGVLKPDEFPHEFQSCMVRVSQMAMIFEYLFA